MKKIITYLVFIVFSLLIGAVFLSSTFAANKANCQYKEWDTSISQNLDECLKGSQLVAWWNAVIEDGFKKRVNTWVNAISLFLWVCAVWAIVFGAMRLTLSAGDDGKVEKAKDIIKRALIGFIGLISASAIIKLVISVMYGLAV